MTFEKRHTTTFVIYWSTSSDEFDILKRSFLQSFYGFPTFEVVERFHLFHCVKEILF